MSLAGSPNRSRSAGVAQLGHEAADRNGLPGDDRTSPRDDRRRRHDDDRSRRRPPSIRIERLGHSLLVCVGGHRSRRGAAVASQLPAEEGRVAVVVPGDAVKRMPDVAYRLQQWVPVVWESVRLVAARAALHAGDGLPPAQELADLLGVEVLAPDGRLVGQPDGSLFVVAGRDQRGRGVWWRFRTGRQPEATGRRFPVPEWEHDLAGFTDPGISGVTVEEIPAGLWVRRAAPAHFADLAWAIPVDPDNMALLVSRPGDPPLRTGDVRALVQAMPEALRERLTVIPYGDAPVATAHLGAVVSSAANQTLRMHPGVPLRLSSRTTQPVTIGPDGRPGWRPFARELAWRAHGGPRVLNWTVPSDQLLPAGPAQFLVSPRWHVEVIEAGLWIRESDRIDGAAVVRCLPVSSRYCTIVVGACGGDQGRPPWRAIIRLLQRLPSDAQKRVRVAVPQAAGSRLARSAAALTRYVPGDRPVYLLTEDGQVLSPSSRPDRRLPGRTSRDRDYGTRERGYRPRERDPGFWDPDQIPRDDPTGAAGYRGYDGAPSRTDRRGERGAAVAPPNRPAAEPRAERPSPARSATAIPDIVVGNRRDGDTASEPRDGDGATAYRRVESGAAWPGRGVNGEPAGPAGRGTGDRSDGRSGADRTE